MFLDRGCLITVSVYMIILSCIPRLMPVVEVLKVLNIIVFNEVVLDGKGSVVLVTFALCLDAQR